MNARTIGIIVALATIVLLYSHTPEKPVQTDVVVCWAALDKEFSEPILQSFEKETGIRVDMKFDAESTKTIGLTNRLLEEHKQGRGTCDVFWNNEIVNTIRLKQAGALATYQPQAASAFPREMKDPDHTWTGFAARARVLIVNTDKVKPEEMPSTMQDLLNPKWSGQIGIAKPFYGSTATWLTALYTQWQENADVYATGEALARDENLDLQTVAFSGFQVLEKLAKQKALRVLDGNKRCAEAVGRGTLAMAFTDTDDAVIEKENGNPVKLVYLDRGAAEEGILLFPNTLSIMKNAPHEENARKLVDYLLSPQVEIKLAKGPSAQIPVNPAVETLSRVSPPREAKLMDTKWDRIAGNFESAMEWAKIYFNQ